MGITKSTINNLKWQNVNNRNVFFVLNAFMHFCDEYLCAFLNKKIRLEPALFLGMNHRWICVFAFVWICKWFTSSIFMRIFNAYTIIGCQNKTLFLHFFVHCKHKTTKEWINDRTKKMYINLSAAMLCYQYAE